MFIRKKEKKIHLIEVEEKFRYAYTKIVKREEN